VPCEQGLHPACLGGRWLHGPRVGLVRMLHDLGGMGASRLQITTHLDFSVDRRSRARVSDWAPFPIAILVAIAGLAGIFDPAIYARETASWAAQGIGQDWVNVLVAAPLLLAIGGVAFRGSRKARVLLGGALLYTSYSFVIYALAVHFNALFLIYCAVLGLSTFALVDLVTVLRADDPPSWYDDRAPIKTAAGTLLAIAAVFGAMWLAQDVPAVLGGDAPGELAAIGLPTNAVHVLDLSLVLPAMVITAVSFLRGRPLGRVLAPVLLGFGVLMALAIGGMVLVMNLRGVAIDVTPVIAMVAVATVCVVVLGALLRHLRA